MGKNLGRKAVESNGRIGSRRIGINIRDSRKTDERHFSISGS
jgi:hypothetical protein